MPAVALFFLSSNHHNLLKTESQNSQTGLLARQAPLLRGQDHVPQSLRSEQIQLKDPPSESTLVIQTPRREVTLVKSVSPPVVVQRCRSKDLEQTMPRSSEVNMVPNPVSETGKQTHKQTKNPPSLGREQRKNNSLIIHMTHTYARISQLSLFMMRMQT